MSGKLTVPYRDRVSIVMSIKIFEIPAVTVPCIDRNRYGQFPTHTKTALVSSGFECHNVNIQRLSDWLYFLLCGIK